MGQDHNRGVFMTKTIRRKDLRYAITEATKLTAEARRIDMSPGYHQRAGKAWDRVAFLTKDVPDDIEVHNEAVECARLEYARMEEVQRLKG